MSFFVQLPIDSYPDQLPAFGQGHEFSYPTAQAMMWLAQLTYEPDSKVVDVLKKWRLTLVAHLHSPTEGPLSDTATQGFVCQRDGATIVAFAGTDPGMVKTLLTDVTTVPGPDGMHPGFGHALEAVWGQVLAVVPGLDPGSPFVTGHSLGAALAALAAFRLHTEANIGARAVYTFGMPRVGGQTFGDLYEPTLGDRTFRLVNGDDPVPSVPPPIVGFRHVGRRMSCPHDGAFAPKAKPATVRDNEPSFLEQEANNASDTLVNLLKGILPVPAQPGPLGVFVEFLPGGIADHLQARYLRALGTPVMNPTSQA